MAGGFPYSPNLSIGTNLGAVTGSSTGTTVTASASLNTKGSWVSLGQIQKDVCALLVMLNKTGGTATAIAVDIGVGASGSQVVVVSNLLINCTTSATAVFCSDIFVPVNIPAGASVWARCQASVASATVVASVIVFDGDISTSTGCAGIDAIGFNASNTTTTSLTSSATAHTKGAYSTVGVTTRDYCGLVLRCGSATSTAAYLCDVAVGDAGVEQIIIPNANARGNSLGAGSFGGSVFLPISIPAGTRISGRSQGSASSVIPIVLYGAYK
jgi:hypothetical protein